MDGLDQIASLYLEIEGFAVSRRVIFPVETVVYKAMRTERQTEVFEIDLVAARADKIRLCSVKSFLTSQEIGRQGFKGIADEGLRKTHFDEYKLFNDPNIRRQVTELACQKYGYQTDQVELVLFAGKVKAGQEAMIRQHLESLAPHGLVTVLTAKEILPKVLEHCEQNISLNNPIVTMTKLLHQEGLLKSEPEERV